ncbi:MAG TPA: hypothetical protein DD490_22095 [Acidobacteria bacterium]|nr:hypothetical protein [Acidobacteriota bacterium]
MPDDQRNPPKPPVGPHKEKKKKEEKKKGAAPERVAESAASEEDAPLILTPDHPSLQPFVEALRANRRSLLSIPGVVAVDIGYKIVDGVYQEERALRVHVERKLPEEAFEGRRHEYIPKCGAQKAPETPRPQVNGVTLAEPFKLKGSPVTTDVIEANYKAMQFGPPRPDMSLEKPREVVDGRRRLDPLVGGISIGSPEAPAGTLGALVWDNKDGSVCILSNWHVLSGDPRTEAGTPCFQPGRLDGGRSSDEVALLKRWSFDNKTDAAIAELTGSRHYCAGEILSLYQQITGTTPPHLGMLVQKVSRSTGFTWGFVDGFYFTSTIEFNNGIVKAFEDQIHIAPPIPGGRISEPGDSGAVWVTKTKDEGYKAVGLHFAGDLPNSSFGEYALANPISAVTERLEISFRPLFLEIRDAAVEPLTEEAGQHRPNGRGRRQRGGSGGQPDPIQPGSTG